jgi:mannitol-specific phosphotransferase system IIBC component
MTWEKFFDIIGQISDILGLISIIISFAVWLSFGKFKKEIEREKIKYVEDQKKILKNLKSVYESLFTDNQKDDDIISDLRKQVYSINKKFKRLMIKDDLKCITDLIKITEKNVKNIDFDELRQKFDFIITSFEERNYDYER